MIHPVRKLNSTLPACPPCACIRLEDSPQALIGQAVKQSINPSIHQSINPSIHQSNHPTIQPSINSSPYHLITSSFQQLHT
jgi:hypothetical protein